MSFLMTTNRTVNAIILVQRGLRFCWKNECEFLQCPPPPTPPFCIDCTFLLLRFKDGSKQLCVKSSDNKLGLPSCRGSSLVQWASLVPHRWSSSSRWLLSTLLAFFFFLFSSCINTAGWVLRPHWGIGNWKSTGELWRGCS